MTAEQKIAKLATISWQDFLLQLREDDARTRIPFFLGQGGRNNKRVDTTPALEAARRGSVGFNGLGLEFEEGFRESSYTFHFPDGNASIARLLVNRLIPAAVARQARRWRRSSRRRSTTRSSTRRSRSMRIRLNSTVVRVQHDGDARARDGRTRRLSARRQDRTACAAANVVLACYNALIPSLDAGAAGEAEGRARVLR